MRYATTIVGDHARAEDVVQEAWFRFGAAAAKADEIREPIGYLYRIVRNLAIDSNRRGRREQQVVGESLTTVVSLADHQATPEATAAARDDLRLLIQVMDELPERTRIALEMRRIDGCKLKDIAARLDVSVPLACQIVAEGIAYCRHRLRPAR